MTHAAAGDLSFRRPTEADHARVLAVLEPWWGGFKGADGVRERALLVPRLYFQHFTTTSCLAEHPDGTLAAFLVGFLSQTEPAIAYIHFVGVDPALHGQGVGDRCTKNCSAGSTCSTGSSLPGGEQDDHAAAQ